MLCNKTVSCCRLHVQRDTVLEEAYVKLMSVPLIYLQQSHLAVVFTREEGYVAR